MKKINLFVLIIAILMTFMYINSREKISALGISIEDYADQIAELQAQVLMYEYETWKTPSGESLSNLPQTNFEEDVYLAYAELVEADVENDTYYFRTLNVKHDDGFDGIYKLVTDMAVYDYAPYVLTMESNGTKTTTDDSITVVWIATP